MSMKGSNENIPELYIPARKEGLTEDNEIMQELYSSPILFEVNFDNSNFPKVVVQETQAEIIESTPRITLFEKLKELKEYYHKLIINYIPPESVDTDAYGEFVESTFNLKHIFERIYTTLHKLAYSDVEYKRKAVMSFIEMMRHVKVEVDDPSLNWLVIKFGLIPMVNKINIEQALYVAEKIQDALEEFGYHHISVEVQEYVDTPVIGIAIY